MDDERHLPTKQLVQPPEAGKIRQRTRPAAHLDGLDPNALASSHRSHDVLARAYGENIEVTRQERELPGNEQLQREADCSGSNQFGHVPRLVLNIVRAHSARPNGDARSVSDFEGESASHLWSREKMHDET